MNPIPSTALSDSPSPEQPARSDGPIRSWVRFWFTPVDPISLHVVRLLAGVLFLAWLLPLAGQLDALFSLQGWFDKRAYLEASRFDGGPPVPISWSLLYGIGSASTLALVYWMSIGVVVLFTLGICTRLTSILTYLIVASFTANPALSYDADPILLIVSFYLMLAYVFRGLGNREAGWFSRLLGGRDSWLLGPSAKDGVRESVAANLALRLLQVHLALVVVAMGVHKLQFGDWWGGVAFWYPLYPALETSLAEARAFAPHAVSFLFIMSLAVYLSMAWQIGFPLFAWRPALRPLLLVGALVYWLGTAFIYRMPLLGPTMFITCLSFVSPAGWRSLLGRITQKFRKAAVPEQPPVVEKGKPKSFVTVGQS